MEDWFPALRGKDYRFTSPADGRYNCIAWAAGESFRWWWPADPVLGYHWPEGVERAITLTAFIAAFAVLGYELCSSSVLEAGHEKVALFAHTDGEPTHAARQLSNGRWTSKLGNLDDIEHDLNDIEGEIYGSVVQLLRRLRQAP